MVSCTIHTMHYAMHTNGRYGQIYSLSGANKAGRQETGQDGLSSGWPAWRLAVKSGVYGCRWRLKLGRGCFGGLLEFLVGVS